MKTRKQLIKRNEKGQFVKEYHALHGFKKGCTPWTKDRHLSDEHKRKLSESHKGKILSEEHKRKISESKRNPSKETRKKLSDAFKGKTYEEMYGEDKAKERKIKMSKSLKGHPTSEETKQKISESNKGNICSEETRIKMSLARKGKYNGENHPNWLGGISHKPYTWDFSRSFKRKIMERDNNCCVICNKPQGELKKALIVHHIDYNKINSFPQNCVSLCNSCHSKTNFNRVSWTVFFQSLLKKRYDYQYTQDQKIILDFIGR